MKQYQTLISAEQLKEILHDDHVVILDCRSYLDDLLKGRKEFVDDHILKASYLDLTHDLSAPVITGVTGRHPLPDPTVMTFTFRRVGINNNTQVIAYDQGNGAYASRAWWLLRWLGHHDVAVLDGGYPAWKSASGETDNQWTLPKEGNFQPAINNDLVVEMNSLLNTDSTIVDSRDYKRYTGEFEPIDPVAGHIPGAVCMPFMENTSQEGIWKSAGELYKRFADIEKSNVPPVFYCGSGVTACHNILAYKIATGKDALLYPGSWSEWINYHKPAS